MRKAENPPIPQKSIAEFSARARFSAISEQSNPFSFFLGLVRSSYAYRLWERYVKYFRRFRVVSTAFRLFPWILLLISTNTLLYAVAAAAVFLLPFLFFALVSFAGSALIRFKKVNRNMQEHLRDRTVYVFFPERSREFSIGSFWRGNVLNLARRDDVCVVIVSPFLFSPRGLFQSSFYFNARAERKNIFLIRRHYFFSLKKHVLTNGTRRSIFIY